MTQSEAKWLDLSEFLDVVAFVETKNLASGANVYGAFQTSPTRDETLFQTMNDTTVATGTPLALGVQTFILLRDTALCPLARWFRWQLVTSGASAFEATFRVWVAANQPGGYGQSIGAERGDGASDGGGPAWAAGPESTVVGLPTPKLGDIVQLMKRGVVLGKNTDPIKFGKTSSPAPSHWHWYDKMKAPTPHKNDWQHRVSRFRPEVPGVRVRWVSPEVKKS